MPKRRFFYDTEFIEYPCTIDLISIGIVGEDGSDFYGINWDCNFDKASQWVKDNVITQLPPKAHPAEDNPWMTHHQLGNAVLNFLKPSKVDPVELWGYYADYDHVALCWLFGSMVDLPAGMPMFTLDVKQLALSLGNPKIEIPNESHHDALADARWTKKAYEFLLRKEETISDGFGSTWLKRCPECGKDSMVVIRPGKVQCNNCG